MRPHPDIAEARRIMQQGQRSIAKRLGRGVQITLRGRLSDRFATAFPGMTLVPRRGRTDLVGEVVDQAHLYGLLTRIRDLGLELESVNPVADEISAGLRPDRDEHEKA
jgi:hypothetical protein